MANFVLSQADAGRVVAVNPDDTIVVQLEENPTTGYLWKVEQSDSRVLELTSQEYEPAAAGGIGGGGARKMVFRAKQSGTSPLLLKCVRQWEPDNVLGTFSVTIDVQP